MLYVERESGEALDRPLCGRRRGWTGAMFAGNDIVFNPPPLPPVISTALALRFCTATPQMSGS